MNKSTNAVAAQNDPGRRVLVVDDNVDLTASLRLVLQRWNHQVEIACDGVEALVVARRFLPQVVLLDLGLPGLGGLELAQRLRQERALGPMRLVAVTGYDDQDRVRQARAAGCDELFVKPIDPLRLKTLLASYAPAG